MKSLFLTSLILFSTPGAYALTAQGQVELDQVAMMGVAKRHLLTQMFRCSQSLGDIIKLEDTSAGLIRFAYKDDRVSDENALIEIIEQDANQSLVKVTLPTDFGGRAELLKDKLVRASSQLVDGNKGQMIPFDQKKVYRSALRYILKQFVSGKEKKEDVICLSLEDVGLIRLKYKRGSFSDPEARIEVTPAGKNASRVWVTLPSSSLDRQILLESDLVSSIRADLGESPKSEDEHIQ